MTASSTTAGPAPDSTIVRSSSISVLKRLTAFAERAAMPYASSTRRSACGKEIFSRAARASIIASDRSPMPRLGTLSTRRSETVSSGLARTRR